ncbi:membrane transport protein-domain-containing protein [Russula aff. rugulosa BPL654]|nr:membrane transport protein-domain-containing protein [Russula aff. rugulosa BPL654]
MISTGYLLWTSIRPLLRTFLTVSAGFALSKAKLFPTEAARGVAQIVMNIALPCLLFSHIVPAFNSQNISSMAPVTVVGLIYAVAGLLMAWTIKRLFWVPHRFRYGILATGSWGTYGDLPTSISLGIMASAPFSGVDDENLAIAYLSTLMLLFYIAVFPLGGFLMVSKDFEGPDVASEELRDRTSLQRRRMFTNVALSVGRLLRLHGHPNGSKTRGSEVGVTSRKMILSLAMRSTIPETTLQARPNRDHTRNRDRPRKPLKSPLHTAVIELPTTLPPVAPDGQPPLAFILDMASFAGAAYAPMGLLCLGSAIACLQLRSEEPLPTGAIAALALAKMVVTPLIGVGITRWFAHLGFIHRDDKVLQFVCILLSGLPGPTTQVFLTQIHSPTGSADHLSAFMIPQYILLPFTMTVLVIYTLSYLF